MSAPFKFPGFQSPNYTQVPDELFDHLLPNLSEAELKVLLYIIRRTFGFKRESDNISLSQMVNGITTKAGRQIDHGAGLSKSGVVKALRGLVAKNIVLPTRRTDDVHGHQPTNYRLNVIPHNGATPESPMSGGSREDTSAHRAPPLSTPVHKGDVYGRAQALYTGVHIQETVRQQTDLENVNVPKIEDEDGGPRSRYPTSIAPSVADILKSTTGRYQPGRPDPATDGDQHAAYEAKKHDWLVADILKVTGDRHSRNFYRQLARTMPEGIISMALTDTRDAKAAGRIQKTAGAYFTDAVKQLAELRGIPLNFKPRPRP